MKTYSVWVGGSEVNDNYLTKKQAEELANEYKADGYDDVAIRKGNTMKTQLGCPVCGTECGLSQYECENRERDYMKTQDEKLSEAVIIINELLGWADEVTNDSPTVNACRDRFTKLMKVVK